ncbi:MAG: hypothetical protein ACRCTK_05460 [Alphaproteobacteria bacterium]
MGFYPSLIFNKNIKNLLRTAILPCFKTVICHFLTKKDEKYLKQGMKNCKLKNLLLSEGFCSFLEKVKPFLIYV